VGSGVR